MKKILFAAFAAMFCLASCVSSELEDRVGKVENRLDALEAEVARLQSNFDAVQTAVNALKNSDYVKNVVPLSDGTGYLINFATSGSVTIYNGVKGDRGPQGNTGDPGLNGNDGHSPEVSVKEVDGVYYWAVDGELVADANGNPIAVTGNAPKVQVTDGHLQVSYDEGKTWIDLGKTGKDLFEDVQKTDDSVIFTLSDGTTIEIPLVPTFRLQVKTTKATVIQGGEFTIEYSILGAESSDEVVTVMTYISEGYSAKISDPYATEGTIKVSAPASIRDDISMIILQSINNTTGAVSSQAIVIEGEVIRAGVEAVTTSMLGGKVEIAVITNGQISNVESSEAWLVYQPATKAVRTETLTLTAEPNNEAARTATVTITTTAGSKLEVVVNQEAASIEALKGMADLFYGSGNSLGQGKWTLLNSATANSYANDPKYADVAAHWTKAYVAERLFDGKVNPDGQFISQWETEFEWPVEYILDLGATIAPVTLFVTDYTNVTNAEVELYMASSYDAENTTWTKVLASEAVEYMTEAAYAEQAEYFAQTYAYDCDAVKFGRYMKVAITKVTPQSDLNQQGFKLLEIAIAGVYANPEETPMKLSTYTGAATDGNWTIVKGQEYTTTMSDYYMSKYGLQNLVDGKWMNHGAADRYDGIWLSQWAEDGDINLYESGKFPLSFVIDLNGIYTPYVFHKVDAVGHQGQYRKFDLYMADTYDATEGLEGSTWKEMGHVECGYEWNGTTGTDYAMAIPTPQAGRYMRIDILEPSQPTGPGDYLGGRGYLAEFYFDGKKVKDIEYEAVYGTNWDILEGENIHMASSLEYEEMCAAYGTYSGIDDPKFLEKAASKATPVRNMIDGNGNTLWRTLYWKDNEYPMTFVFDMKQKYTPARFHKWNSNWCQGTLTNITISLADSYDGANTAWTTAFDGEFGIAHWQTSDGLDEVVPVAGTVGGRYLKLTFNGYSPADYGEYPDGAAKSKNPGELREFYFEVIK